MPDDLDDLDRHLWAEDDSWSDCASGHLGPFTDEDSVIVCLHCGLPDA